VSPRADIPLVDWPSDGTFMVPVQIATPGEAFVYEVFEDYPANQVPAVPRSAPSLATDGGVALVRFVLRPPPPDNGTCPHRIEFIVANGFAGQHTPDSVGGDIVTWFYTEGGGPNGCPSYDAGTGAFPDAASDVLPVPPEAGGDP
jgi:hypothetical protein